MSLNIPNTNILQISNQFNSTLLDSRSYADIDAVELQPNRLVFTQWDRRDDDDIKSMDNGNNGAVF
jgi:hypothetical protein